MTSDHSIREQIADAIEEERTLRADLAAGRITQEHENNRIAGLEDHLDQLWDSLRQRQAERDAGQDPNDATLRSVEQVEGYEG